MIYRVDRLTENNINPITNFAYDDSWIVLMLTDSVEYEKYCGSHNGCAYTVKISRLKCENWKMAVGDFVSFYGESEKNTILVMDEADYVAVQKYYGGHKYNDSFLRKDEPAVLVHSTSASGWEQIKRDGMLKCWNRLKIENAVTEKQPIGIKLGDPADFSDFIMLGSGITGEIVVNSRQKGRITMNVDEEYLTGARLYFDAEKIARDGLLFRDGIHLAVKDKLQLAPYLIWAATWNSIGLESQISTPRIFAEQSDYQFHKRFAF